MPDQEDTNSSGNVQILDSIGPVSQRELCPTELHLSDSVVCLLQKLVSDVCVCMFYVCKVIGFVD